MRIENLADCLCCCGLFSKFMERIIPASKPEPNSYTYHWNRTNLYRTVDNDDLTGKYQAGTEEVRGKEQGSEEEHSRFNSSFK